MLINFISEAGCFAFVCADIAARMLNCLLVMDAFYVVYTRLEPVDEFCVMYTYRPRSLSW